MNAGEGDDRRFDADVMVIGSRFGGSVAALRFADAGRTRCPRTGGSASEARRRSARFRVGGVRLRTS